MSFQTTYDFREYLDIDGFVTPGKGKGSFNGLFYTGLTLSLGRLIVNEELDTEKAYHSLCRNWPKRGSYTGNVVSYDDIYGAKMLSIVAEQCVRPLDPFDPFEMVIANKYYQPGMPRKLKHWLCRNPSFYFIVNRKKSIVTDFAIATTGLFEQGSTPFLVAHLITCLVPVSPIAIVQMHKNAEERWPGKGLLGAFEEHFEPGHPIIKLAEDVL